MSESYCKVLIRTSWFRAPVCSLFWVPEVCWIGRHYNSWLFHCASAISSTRVPAHIESKRISSQSIPSSPCSPHLVSSHSAPYSMAENTSWWLCYTVGSSLNENEISRTDLCWQYNVLSASLWLFIHLVSWGKTPNTTKTTDINICLGTRFEIQLVTPKTERY